VKLGLFSDIHGNHAALVRVIEFLRDRGATSFVCAGDIVGYGPEPAACVELVRGLRGTVVAGNHDWGVVGRLPATAFNEAARAALEWTRGRLSEDALAFLDSLALVEDSAPLHLVHSAPSAPEQWEYVFSVREAEEEMDSFAQPICVVGHSHYTFAAERRHGETRLLSPAGFVVRPDARYLVNVGSVGQPRDGDPRSACALYDTETYEFSFFRLEYDLPSVQAQIRAAGLPSFLADRLALGR
jgi:diadenosine tetraphosphatase ApaH/serine/threonine PP2A family protein phosphatase